LIRDYILIILPTEVREEQVQGKSITTGKGIKEPMLLAGISFTRFAKESERN
jgi:hypothetical protein